MIRLDYRDARPIYEQVRDGLRRLVMSGVYGPNEKLPSVRDLAKDLAINPNTIQRAYRELEAEGCIYTVSGRGSFVSEAIDPGGVRRGELLQKFDETVKELMLLNETVDTLKRRIDEIRAGGDKE